MQISPLQVSLATDEKEKPLVIVPIELHVPIVLKILTVFGAVAKIVVKVERGGDPLTNLLVQIGDLKSVK